ncbi:MAG: GTPase HflX [Candidatus Diapherotrites archaeon ADurb.Bin253]|jgi:ribosome-interacting GTPase 1|nr:50S ribosome-binding GTPase [Candidatus Pacearchaeota archaeon]OQA69134.1 MAG: GTPase HflX [Candidatus Diapherotrites archaeon ADurb.Bin253]HNZ52005.1 50S ribosome-binding GTPase [Candidatus Pacearchaeota archaeon]HOC96665.1 50S ribosome-binding GTPase [Candidatus Pacearchaeota archaeon]HOF43931.1 50S ribosome-binding GTPase [Candidatus Pacearchaeota archaeon]
MPINAHPEYIAAEGEYLRAKSVEEKIEKLKKMISYAPSHKGGENLRAQLKTRLKKLLEEKEKSKKSGKSSRTGIKKEDLQAVIIGKSNSGKSSVLTELTNAKAEVSHTHLSTTTPKIGMMNYQGANIQIIENPAIESEYYDKGITNTTDTLIIIINSIQDLKEIETMIGNIQKNKIVLFNKSDLLNLEEKRKISSTLQSKKYNFVLFSSISKEGIELLKEKLFSSFNKIRVYTKEPGKEKSKNPIILKPGATTREVAEKILKGFSEKVKETKIWGPSSKFPGQIVGLNHKLRDLDVVEFKTK